MKRRVLIVGGVAGGASAAARLRRLDESAEIILFERGEHISFANCGLPYYIGGVIKERSDLLLQTAQDFHSRFRIDVRTLHEVISIDRANKTIAVKNVKTRDVYVERYDKLILSPGASPMIPDMEGVSSKRVFTLRSIPDADRINAFMEQRSPKSAVIVGGGYIGVEMAENLAKAGLSVSIVELSSQVIAPLDFDMACEVHRHLRLKGIDLYLNTALQKMDESGNGLVLTLSCCTMAADMVILAVGVRPESGIAKAAGLATGEKGGIIVSEHMLTSDEHIYAVGDAVEVMDFVGRQKAMIPLAGPANKQGRIAADHICGIQSAYKGTQGSAILKVFGKTIAATGINEKTANALNIAYEKSFIYAGSHAGYYPGSEEMAIKILFEKETGKILGCQIIGGEGVDKRCDIVAVAIRAGMKAADVAALELCYAPPYASAKDPVNMAGYVIENIVTGKVRIFHWHDVQALRSGKGATLIDVRTKEEYEEGHIDGFCNIPLDELRDRLCEIAKDMPVYVVCQVGLRGYLAARILMHSGYDASNLSGGYRLYETVVGEG